MSIDIVIPNEAKRKYYTSLILFASIAPRNSIVSMPRKGIGKLTFAAPWRWSIVAKTKTFDCVEMKRRAQDQLLAEFEKQKERFSSYRQFLDFQAKQSAWQSRLWKEIQGN